MPQDALSSTFDIKYVEDNAVAVTNAMACVLKQICDLGDEKSKQLNESACKVDGVDGVDVQVTTPPRSPTQVRRVGRGNRRNPFEGRRHLSINILDYVRRVLKYMNCSASCFVLAVMYIDRLIHKKGSSIVINSLTIHRLIIVSVVCSIKMWDDKFFPNSYYAKVGGLSISELNRLEAFFLFTLNFDMHIKPADFDQYLKTLTTHALDGRCTQGCVAQCPALLEIPTDKRSLTAFAPHPFAAAECVTPKNHNDPRNHKRKVDSCASVGRPSKKRFKSPDNPLDSDPLDLDVQNTILPQTKTLIEKCLPPLIPPPPPTQFL